MLWWWTSEDDFDFFWFCKFELKHENTKLVEKQTYDGLWLLFEGVSGVFAHGQLHILNVIFRLTAVCEIAMSNKKDKLKVGAVKCVFFVRKVELIIRSVWQREKGESAV